MLHEIMKEYRLRAGLSNKEAAALLLIEPPALSKYESGLLNLSISQFASMCYLYQIPRREVANIILQTAHPGVVQYSLANEGSESYAVSHNRFLELLETLTSIYTTANERDKQTIELLLTSYIQAYK
ncbi:helix-turn-helix domain-containing protein [Paenisporosarcina cavernae]|uniref:XRE family transcriptional regulator n=1 Tax=Paenisporosarcina cavernae TaxID=2320858 RepID=A0A385YQT0_9BACL|nr:helix-turn-helix transcriptional regulator [Paenisporosarcina cavernae]AYC28854.1 XRE family transcriptional regulator [Paenisporosarcina cavernae]